MPDENQIQPPENQNTPKTTPIGAKEHLYDQIPLTKKHWDIIIVILIAAFIIFLTLGALKGNGLL